MALQFFDGFDEYLAADTTQIWTSGTNNFNSMVTGLLGVGQAGRSSAGNNIKRALPSALGTIIIGWRHRLVSSGGNGTNLALYDVSSNVIASVGWNSLNNTFSYYRGGNAAGSNNFSGTAVSSASPAIAVNGVNYFELKIVLSTSATGSYSFRMNGQVISSASSVITCNTTAAASFLGIGCGPACSFDFDDLYVCDTSGTTNNDFLGDVKVLMAMPNGAGRVTAWTPTGAASNWQCVNQAVEDGDTTYVASSTPGQVDCYTLSSIGSVGNVFGVQTNVFLRKDDAGTRTVATGLGNGTTENFDAGTAVPSTYTYFVRTFDKNPFTSNPWATGDLSTLQAAISEIA